MSFEKLVQDVMGDTRDAERLDQGIKALDDAAQERDTNIKINEAKRRAKQPKEILDATTALTGAIGDMIQEANALENTKLVGMANDAINEEMQKLEKMSPADAMKALQDGVLEKAAEKHLSKFKTLRGGAEEELRNEYMAKLNQKKLTALGKEQARVTTGKIQATYGAADAFANKVYLTGHIDKLELDSLKSKAKELNRKNPKLASLLKQLWVMLGVRQDLIHSIL